MTIKNRLKELDIKITELANYLQISRPTMYKFIDLYDSGNKKDVNPSVVKLFDYISKSELIGKRNVINYILSKMSTVQNMDTDETNELLLKIKEYVVENPNSEKTQFIIKSIEQSQFDIIIHYLMDIVPLLKKKKLTQQEENKLQPYKNIIDIYVLDKEGK